MNKKIYLSPPHLTDEAVAYLKDAVDSNWIAPVGPHVDAFERELANVGGISHAVATNSATSAIHLGLLALGAGKADEVLCSTSTFCASVNPVIYSNATPVFVDSEEGTWNMDPLLLGEAIEDRIRKTGKKPKAIILVHLYGMPARLKEIMALAGQYEIPVLEDAAEALGSSYGQRMMGTFGHMGAVSFNGNKIITTSSGGALFSRDAGLADKAKYFCKEAREPKPYYEHRAVGYNYRMSNLLAAVGRSQLKVLNDRVMKRRSVFDYYTKAFHDLPFVKFQNEPQGAVSNRWLTVIDIQNNAYNPEVVRLALEKQNIESRRVWNPMHLQPVFAHFPAYVNGVSERIFHHGLCLPSGSSLTDEDLERVVEAVKTVLR